MSTASSSLSAHASEFPRSWGPTNIRYLMSKAGIDSEPYKTEIESEEVTNFFIEGMIQVQAAHAEETAQGLNTRGDSAKGISMESSGKYDLDFTKQSSVVILFSASMNTALYTLSESGLIPMDQEDSKLFEALTVKLKEEPSDSASNQSLAEGAIKLVYDDPDLNAFVASKAPSRGPGKSEAETETSEPADTGASTIPKTGKHKKRPKRSKGSKGSKR